MPNSLTETTSDPAATADPGTNRTLGQVIKAPSTGGAPATPPGGGVVTTPPLTGTAGAIPFDRNVWNLGNVGNYANANDQAAFFKRMGLTPERAATFDPLDPKNFANQGDQDYFLKQYGHGMPPIGGGFSPAPSLSTGQSGMTKPAAAPQTLRSMLTTPLAGALKPAKPIPATGLRVDSPQPSATPTPFSELNPMAANPQFNLMAPDNYGSVAARDAFLQKMGLTPARAATFNPLDIRNFASEADQQYFLQQYGHGTGPAAAPTLAGGAAPPAVYDPSAARPAGNSLAGDVRRDVAPPTLTPPPVVGPAYAPLPAGFTLLRQFESTGQQSVQGPDGKRYIVGPDGRMQEDELSHTMGAPTSNLPPAQLTDAQLEQELAALKTPQAAPPGIQATGPASPDPYATGGRYIGPAPPGWQNAPKPGPPQRFGPEGPTQPPRPGFSWVRSPGDWNTWTETPGSYDHMGMPTVGGEGDMQPRPSRTAVPPPGPDGLQPLDPSNPNSQRVRLGLYDAAGAKYDQNGQIVMPGTPGYDSAVMRFGDGKPTPTLWKGVGGQYQPRPWTMPEEQRRGVVPPAPIGGLGDPRRYPQAMPDINRSVYGRTVADNQPFLSGDLQAQAIQLLGRPHASGGNIGSVIRRVAESGTPSSAIADELVSKYGLAPGLAWKMIEGATRGFPSGDMGPQRNHDPNAPR